MSRLTVRRHRGGRRTPRRAWSRLALARATILGLQKAMRVLCMVSIGHPAEKKPPVPAEKLAWEKILPGT